MTADRGEVLYVAMSEDREHIRIWTKDRAKAKRFVEENGGVAVAYAPLGETIERCAKVCDGLLPNYAQMNDIEQNGFSFLKTADWCAEAIRALAPAAIRERDA